MTFKLQCAEILNILRNKTVLISTPSGLPVPCAVNFPLRQKRLAPLLPLIHQAEKFIFDSGSDQDPDTVQAVKDTARNMIEAGIFHQPYPIIWVEDPYDSDPDHLRNFYLGLETEDQITIYFFAQMPELPDLIDANTDIIFHPYELVISFKDHTDFFGVGGADYIPPAYSQVLGEAVYAYKKLLVTLATTNAEREEVKAAPRKRGEVIHAKNRAYDHQIIRVPVDLQPPVTGSSSNNSPRKSPQRAILVRGYIWGRRTRPIEQQRWIAPYWRGRNIADPVELDESDRHYEIVQRTSKGSKGP